MNKKTSEQYEHLYHYTTWEGCQGILTSQSLWATHYKFLNDYSEFMLFRDRLVSLMIPEWEARYQKLLSGRPDFLADINRLGGVSLVAKYDAEVHVDTMYKVIGHEVYIASFCGEHEKDNQINSNGLLSQWRAYGDDGGVALVFGTKELEDLFSLECEKYQYDVGHLADVVYSDNDEGMKNEFAEDLVELGKYIGKTESTDSPGDGYSAFVSCASRYKHFGFSEEREVRAVMVPTLVTEELESQAKKSSIALLPEKDRKFRETRGISIPYISLFDSPDMVLPIKKIIVGPHPLKEKRAASLCVMLRNSEIEIICSEIPFVGR
ncbi:MAG: DUF2971 domain-containing protein [bacterium]|nr:DUF2971 domain-containing protein [bacterium]